MSFATRLIFTFAVLSLTLGAFSGTARSAPAQPQVPGDADCSGGIAVQDAVAVIRYVASIPPAATCITAADVNCSGTVELADAIRILNSLAGLQQTKACGLIWPFVGPISNPFDPPHHNGIDIDGCNRDGAPVVAAAAGKVKVAKFDDSGYGNYVSIEHADGSWTAYAHLDSFSVAAGQAVHQGEPLGGVGHTGRVEGMCLGTHLHFELHIDGKVVDPLLYLPKQA